MHQVFRTLLVTCFIISITIIIILYGSGYRFNIDKKTLDTTGTLVAKSDPDGAKVLINGKISGATNTNIPLAPGSYEVSLVKEGYITWEKKLPIQGEVVTQTNATLFPKNPSLTALTSSGIINPLVAPDGSKIIYARSEEATTAATFDGKLVTPSGLWVYDLVEPEAMAHAQKLAQELRRDDIAVAVNISGKRVGDQLRQADKLKVPFVIAIGSQERDCGRYTLKNLATGAEITLPADRIAEHLFSALG
jgi:hypothetical protein